MRIYSPKQINEIKQEIRTGKPAGIIAEELSKKWNRPLGGVYSKVWKLSKMTRKVKKEYDGPVRRKYTSKTRKLRPEIVQETIDFNPMPGSILENFNKRVEEMIEDIQVNHPEPVVEQVVVTPQQEIGIEVPVGTMAFTGIPSKIVIYSDHVRYYFDN